MVTNMIWTKDQLIKNLKRHIINDSDIVYYAKDLGNDTFKVSYKPFKDACKIKTEYSYSYWNENLRQFLEDNWMEDMNIYKDENPNATDEQIEAKNEELEKEFDKRFDDPQNLVWYLDEAITELNLVPNEEIDI